jgi:hypothetical protein
MGSGLAITQSQAWKGIRKRAANVAFRIPGVEV